MFLVGSFASVEGGGAGGSMVVWITCPPERPLVGFIIFDHRSLREVCQLLDLHNDKYM